MSVKKVLGIDPGGTSGFSLASVDLDSRSVKWYDLAEVPIAVFSEHLNSYTEVDLIAVEDFTLRPGKKTEFLAQGWTKLETAKLVGRVEQFCFTNSILCRVPQAAEKPFGYKLNKIPYVPGKKGTHIYDSMAHARNAIRKMYMI